MGMTGLKTPLYDWHVAHGGRIVEFGGWLMPVQYSGVVAEHQAVRNAAGLFDISHMGRLSFGGADVLALIQHVWTNDAASMADGQVRYGLMCNDQGGIHDDVLVYRWSYGWNMVVNAANREKIVGVLNREKTGKDVDLVDQTLTTGMLAVQGPKALELCAGLFNFDAGTLKYYHAAAGRCRENQCVVSRTGYTGEDGLEIMIGAAHLPALADELVQRGAVPCGLGARDTLRLEAAMPLYGHELDEQTNPLEAGLAWAVKLAKDEFTGREAIARAKEKIQRQRVGLQLEGRRAARERCPVMLADGRAVGRITSGSYTPTLERSIAMAYVDVAHAAIGTKLLVDIRGNREPATVVPLPFYKRPKT
jgi:glycine cleavage system T protein (aminomethyltransferase)